MIAVPPGLRLLLLSILSDHSGVVATVTIRQNGSLRTRLLEIQCNRDVQKSLLEFFYLYQNAIFSLLILRDCKAMDDTGKSLLTYLYCAQHAILSY